MRHSEMDVRMKALESFHGLRVPPGAYTILRIDGRSFSKFTVAAGFEKPFDRALMDAMAETTQALVKDLGATYGYHESDEISLLFPKDWDAFDREVEKLVSVSAGLATSAFMFALTKRWVAKVADEVAEPATRSMGLSHLHAIQSTPMAELPHFDSRVVVACGAEQVLDYFAWRMADAARCCLNTVCHWTAIQQDGKTASAAGKMFEGAQRAFKHEYLFQHGINFADLPCWQRRGMGHYWEEYRKQGFNPVKSEATVVNRKRIGCDDQLPEGDTYRALLTILMERGMLTWTGPQP